MGSKGFSLIEQLVVFFIIAFFVTIVGSTLYSYRKSVLIKVQKDKITQDMSYAQAQARALQKDVDIVLYSKTYLLKQGNVVLRSVNLDEGFSVTPEHFGFTAKGTPKYAGTSYLFHNNIKVGRLVVAVGSGLYQWKEI